MMTTTFHEWLPTAWGYTRACPWPRDVPDGLDPARARLVRWLVAQGRITDDLACDCGLSDGDVCYCETTDPARIAH